MVRTLALSRVGHKARQVRAEIQLDRLVGEEIHVRAAVGMCRSNECSVPAPMVMLCSSNFRNVYLMCACLSKGRNVLFRMLRRTTYILLVSLL
jgi:hypothetical protein